MTTFSRPGVKLPREAFRAQAGLVDQLALRVLGVLADAPIQMIRRKALEKARRMLGRRRRQHATGDANSLENGVAASTVGPYSLCAIFNTPS